MAGLLDYFNDPETQFNMGLMGNAYGNNYGTAVMKTLQQMREAKANDMQQQMTQEAMSQARLMHPLQLQQLQSALSQQALQQKVAEQLPQMIDSLRSGGRPALYQDQVSPAQVGSSATPQVSFQGTPEQYFGMAASIQDPVEKRSAIEAGLRQWPQYRPQVSNNATSRDPATTLGAFGAMMGTAGLKGGDEVLKFANMLQPRQLQGGSTYQNPLTGAERYMPQYDKNQMPDGQGGLQAIPGAMNFLRQEAQAKVDPVAAGRLLFDTGINVNGQGGQGGGIGVGQSVGSPSGLTPAGRATAQLEAVKGANEDWIKGSYRPTLEASKSADNMLTNVNALRNIDLKTGWGTETKAAGANILAGLGIAPKVAEMYASNAQAFQSQAMTRLWEVLNTAKGPQTEGDAQRAKATYAQLSNTPAANQFILDLAEANARRDKLKAAFYAEAMPVARDAGDFTAVDRKWGQIQRSVWDDPIMAKWRR